LLQIRGGLNLSLPLPWTPRANRATANQKERHVGLSGCTPGNQIPAERPEEKRMSESLHRRADWDCDESGGEDSPHCPSPDSSGGERSEAEIPTPAVYMVVEPQVAVVVARRRRCLRKQGPCPLLWARADLPRGDFRMFTPPISLHTPYTGAPSGRHLKSPTGLPEISLGMPVWLLCAGWQSAWAREGSRNPLARLARAAVAGVAFAHSLLP
jgi:hypothetical protein